jgi:hypothetical protein
MWIGELRDFDTATASLSNHVLGARFQSTALDQLTTEMDEMKPVKVLHLFQSVTPVCARSWQVPRFPDSLTASQRRIVVVASS